MHENWYDRNILPYLIDFACGIKPVRRQRDKVVPLAQGRVLEVGIGTGRNMPFYDRSKVQRIVGLDPALRMHRLALKRIAAAHLDVELVGLSIGSGAGNIVGRTVIVHADPDDFRTQPTGNSGERIACGVIKAD